MAGTVHIHIGQAGNQVGEVFWRLAGEAYLRDSTAAHGPCPLFHGDNKASCILVDSESKVINNMLLPDQLGGKGMVRPQNVCIDSSGRANNWAMGFTSSQAELQREQGLFHKATCAVRREMERMDSVRTVVMFHSLAGGTGSGVGSAMLQYLRDTCAAAVNLTSCAVGPFASGDCATQWHNTALSMYYLTELADSVVYRDNDALLAHHLKTQQGSAQKGPSASPFSPPQSACKASSMADLNASLGADLAFILFPQYTKPNAAAPLHGSVWRPFDGYELSSSCCPFGFAKFFDVRSSWSLMGASPFSSAKGTKGRSLAGCGTDGYSADVGWLDMGKAVCTSFPSREPETNAAYCTIAAHVTLRGVPSHSSAAAAVAAATRHNIPQTCSAKQKPGDCGSRAEDQVKELLTREAPKRLRLVPWQQSNAEVTGLPAACSYDLPAGREGVLRGVGVCANRDQHGIAVQNVLSKAEERVRQRAYTHWYSRHGIEDEDWSVAFEGLRCVVEEYDTLVSGSAAAAGNRKRHQHVSRAVRSVRDYCKS